MGIIQVKAPRSAWGSPLTGKSNTFPESWQGRPATSRGAGGSVRGLGARNHGGLERRDDCWFVVVEPTNPNARSYDYFGRMAEAEQDIAEGRMLSLEEVRAQLAKR